jgi:cyclopropane-fatty-acyl-phospholipid synthase
LNLTGESQLKRIKLFIKEGMDMIDPKIEANSPAAELTIDIIERLFQGDSLQNVGFRLWDGTCWPDQASHPTTIVLKHPGSLRSMLLPGTEVALGEAYLYDDFDVEGNMEDIFALSDSLAINVDDIPTKLRLGSELLRLPKTPDWEIGRRGRANLKGKQHSIERDRQAVTYHYDVSNDFYALWLDRRMVYSCAYFLTPGDELDLAQQQKLDYICRKLRLQPGQRLLDIGCGWGGLVIYASRHFGAQATGITLSQPQANLANARIAEAGLSDHCHVEVRDYRQMDISQVYDALVSVGMFEHVGEELLPVYFAKAWDLLKPGGAFLNHGIACRYTDKPESGPSFSDTYVFPDGDLVPINITLKAAEESGFEVRHVESLREHYARTLRHWVSRLEDRHEDALKYVDEPTYRVWRLFMSGSAYGFHVGRLNVYQTLLVKQDSSGQSGQPLTCADWYEGM